MGCRSYATADNRAEWGDSCRGGRGGGQPRGVLDREGAIIQHLEYDHGRLNTPEAMDTQALHERPRIQWK